MKNDKLTSWPAFTSLSIRSRCASTTPGAASDYSSVLAEVLSRDVNRRQTMSAKSKRSEENKLRKQGNQTWDKKKPGKSSGANQSCPHMGGSSKSKILRRLSSNVPTEHFGRAIPDADSCPARKTR
jgi:hypothetical protein